MESAGQRVQVRAAERSVAAARAAAARVVAAAEPGVVDVGSVGWAAALAGVDDLNHVRSEDRPSSPPVPH